MFLSLQSPQCKKRLKTRAEVAGKKIKCPICATSFVANATAAPVAPPTSATSSAPAHVGEIWAVEELTVRTWDIENQKFGVTLAVGFLSSTTHKSEVRGTASSRDGRWAASVRDDSTFRLWDMNSYKQIQLGGVRQSA